MPAAEEEKMPRKRRARPLRTALLVLLAAVLLVVLVVGVGLGTGRLQKVLLREGVWRTLGARVHVADISIASGVAIHNLYLHDPAWTGPPAALAMGELRLDCALFPEDGRYVRDVTVNGLEVNLWSPQDRRSNYQFLTDFLSAPQSDADPLATMPVNLTLRGASIAITQPGAGGALEGIDLEATLSALDRFAVRVRGEAVRARWWLGEPAGMQHLDAGVLDITAERRPEDWLIQGHARLPGLVDLEVRAEAEQAANDWTLRAEVARAEARGDVLALLPPEALPVPLRFESITVRESRVEAAYAGGALRLPLLSVDAEVPGLSVGPADAPYYAGPLRIHAEGGLTDRPEARIEVTFGRDQVATAVFRAGADPGWTLHAEASGWSKDQLLDLVPGAWRGLAAAYLPLTGAGVTLDAAQATDQWTLSVAVDAALEEAVAKLALEGTYEPESPTPARGRAVWRQGDGELKVDAALDREGGTLATATLEEVALDRWAAAWRPGLLPEGYGATLSGEVDIDASAGLSESWTLRSQLNLAGVRAASVKLPFLEGASVSGSTTIPATLDVAEGADWVLALPSDFTVKLHKWHVDFAQSTMQAAVGAQGGLGWLAEWLSLPELYGDVEIVTPLELNANLVRLAPKLSTGSLAYGAYAVPYGQTLTVSMDDLRYLFSEAALQGSGLRAALDDDNVFTCTHVDAGPGLDRFALREWRLLSNGRPLVDMEFLLDADGSLDATGSATYEGGTVVFDAAVQASGALLALPFTGIRVRDFTLSAVLARDGELTGRGNATAGQVLAGGVTADGVACQLAAEAGALRLAEGTMRVLGADADFEARAGVLEDGLPLSLRIHAHGADLAQFTKEFNPPSVSLTGKATGEIALELREGALSDFRVDLAAGEGFSMNRDLVAQVLMQQYVVDMPGGKSLERMIRDVIGPQPQRAFDSARLNLGFVDGRIRGQAFLESRQLNLTVDIAMDPQALVEAIRARQGDDS